MNDRHINRRPNAYNRKDLVGIKFGKLIVLKDTGDIKNKRPIWQCQCDCGNIARISGKYLLSGDTKSCGCFSKGNAHNTDRVGVIPRSFWTTICNSAKVRGIPFQITRQDVNLIWEKQKGLCALSGCQINISNNLRDERKTHTASLDRIDSNKGYTIDNVQWVHKQVNLMKHKLSQIRFKQLCRMIVNMDKK